jgi:murein tripeptide amidase MpaA
LALVAGGSYLGNGPHRPAALLPSEQPSSLNARPVSDVVVNREVVLGQSVRGRPIVAKQSGDPDSPFVVLVVGCIHGNEPAGIAITNALARSTLPAEVNLWTVPDLNPDGVAERTRGNAHGVDLNRNFPHLWRPLGSPGSSRYSGPTPLSEPEARVAAALLQQIHPVLGIWYHQALNVVDDSEGPRVLEREYASLTRMRLNRLPDYPGSAVGFENARFGPTAFVVELPGRLAPGVAAVQARAVLTLAAKRTQTIR